MIQMAEENEPNLKMVKRPYLITMRDRSYQVTVPDDVADVLRIDKERVKEKDEHINYFIDKKNGYAIIVNSRYLDIKAKGLGPISLESPLSISDFEKIVKRMK
jgi:hypothetical protein